MSSQDHQDEVDPFQLLGVTVDSSEEEVKKAYKRLAMKLHPDHNKAPDANERFQECAKAYEQIMSLQDPNLKNAYMRGGWELVEHVKNRREMHEKMRKVCQPFGIKVPVTLKQLYQREKLPVKADIPVLNANGKLASYKKFEFELPLNPAALNQEQVIRHQGVERPEYVTGDLVIEMELDWDHEPTKFEINGGDLIYYHKLNVKDIFTVFKFEFVHPDGKTYMVEDNYRRPQKNGDQVYVMPGAGLGPEGNLLIIVEVDHESIAEVQSNAALRRQVKHVFDTPFQPPPSKVATAASGAVASAVNVVHNSISLDQYKAMIEEKRMKSMRGFPGMLPPGMLPPGMKVMGGEGMPECHQQ